MILHDPFAGLGIEIGEERYADVCSIHIWE